MAKNYHPKTMIRFICRDFEHAWEALSRVPESELGARGNFMFARQAMTLLEVACRLCDSTALSDFSAELKKRDPRYFTQLPGDCRSPGRNDPLYLPFDGPNPDSQMIAALFDLIRHGQAHEPASALLERIRRSEGARMR